MRQLTQGRQHSQLLCKTDSSLFPILWYFLRSYWANDTAAGKRGEGREYLGDHQCHPCSTPGKHKEPGQAWAGDLPCGTKEFPGAWKALKVLHYSKAEINKETKVPHRAASDRAVRQLADRTPRELAPRQERKLGLTLQLRMAELLRASQRKIPLKSAERDDGNEGNATSTHLPRARKA